MSRGNLTKWLYVGLHIKRWLAFLGIAVAIMGIGFAYILREVYVSYTFPAWAFYLTLQFIPRWLRGMLFITSALALAIFSGWELNRSLAHALLPVGDRQRDKLQAMPAVAMAGRQVQRLAWRDIPAAVARLAQELAAAGHPAASEPPRVRYLTTLNPDDPVSTVELLVPVVK